MAKQPAKKTSAKKTSARPKANASKDYMKPVGGTKQEGYMAPGSRLERKGKANYGYSVGKGAGQKYSGMDDLKSLGKKSSDSSFMYLENGINPKALKATRGNPKPTTAQMATAKKKAAAKAKSRTMETQAQKKKNTKPVKGSTKGATLTGPKPSPSPSTGRYKRNP